MCVCVCWQLIYFVMHTHIISRSCRLVSIVRKYLRLYYTIYAHLTHLVRSKKLWAHYPFPPPTLDDTYTLTQTLRPPSLVFFSPGIITTGMNAGLRETRGIGGSVEWGRVCECSAADADDADDALLCFVLSVCVCTLTHLTVFYLRVAQ